eukprot:TRINITY_DN3018_c1_g1_i1.p1 TRINITY_DN3018_c1_g1~~TRINITY_DN3018_c1_g1_i1.p1  ORF type:complete len:278 (+),score=28.46 TRINITY_DN3018_c1_g1_i1:160-993(+)
MSIPSNFSDDQYREQVRREVERELIVGAGRNTVVVERKNDSLSKEVDTHRCPICIELMLYPNYSPLMLVPCGHTFCSKCLGKYQVQSKRSVCPLCRAGISSTVPNHSLRCIIEAYAHDTINSGPQKVRLNPAFETAIEQISDPESIDQIRDYVSMYSMAEARSKVLIAEQQSSRDELEAVTKTVDVDKQVVLYLTNEQHQIQDQIARLTSELAVVQSQLSDKQEAVKAGGETQQKLDDRIQELQKSITAIDRESLKAKTILSHLAPDLDLEAVDDSP